MSQIDLYREITKDHKTPAPKIAAAILKQSSARRRIVALYAKGCSDRQAGAETHRTHGAARAMLLRTMHGIHKRLNGLPRYHLQGRAHSTPAEPPTQARIRTRGGQPKGLPEPPTIINRWTDHLTDQEKKRLLVN